MDGHVGGGGVQQGVPDDHREDDALAGERVEHDLTRVPREQRHDLRGREGERQGERERNNHNVVLLLCNLFIY